MKDYKMNYWRTTEAEPEPTVEPRLNQKSSKMLMATYEDSEEAAEMHAKLLW